MSLSVQLGDDIITRDAANLQIKSTSPGGFASVSFSLKRRLDKALLEQLTDCLVFDQATGEQVGGGRLMEQGRNDDGTWQVTCLGEGLASMQDITTPVFYVDQTMDGWNLTTRTTRRMEFSTSPYPNSTTPDDPNLFLELADSVTISTNSELVVTNRIAQRCNMYFGGIGYRHKSGLNTSNWRMRARMYTNDLSAFDTIDDDAWDTTISTRAVRTVNGGFTNKAVAGIQWKRLNTDAVTGEDSWSVVRDVILRSQIYGTDGNLRTIGYSNEYILPHEVLIDWVVRYCPRLNAATGTIDTSSTEQIEQMAYLDGIHGVQLAEDVAAQEPGFVWHVWEQGADGTWPFNFTPLPTDVRYEASVDDGFSAPSPSTEIYDQVVVTGKTKAGRDVNVLRTSVVTALAEAGIHRRATIPLGSEVWSTSAANKVGDTFLAEHAVAPHAGTLTVAQPIRDNATGRLVRPWNIRAGELVLVRGVQPTPDTLNATSPDGVTVFRIVSATYDQDSGAATLELDTYELDEQRAIAELYKRRNRKR